MSLILRPRKDSDDDGDDKKDEQQQKQNNEMDIDTTENEQENEQSQSNESTKQQQEEEQQKETEMTVEQKKLSERELRLKRLARFQNKQKQKQNNQKPPSSSTPTDVPQRQTSNPITITPTEPRKIHQTLQTPPKPSTSFSPPPHSPFSPTSPSTFYPSPPSNMFSPPATTPPLKDTETPETHSQWLSRVITSVFSISLTTIKNKALYLPELAKELRAEGKSVEVFDEDSVDRILHHILSLSRLSNNMSLFEYLLRCYNKAYVQLDRSSNKSEKRKSFLNHLIHLFVSYIGLSFKFPEMFPSTAEGADLFMSESSVPGPKQLVPFLMGVDKRSVPKEFIGRLVKRFENDDLQSIFEPVFEELSTQMRATDLLQTSMYYRPYNAFEKLIRHKPLISLLVHLPEFIPNRKKNGKEMEVNSLLGPYFRLTSFPDQPLIKDSFFDNTLVSQEADKLKDIRARLRLSQNGCYRIILTLLRSGKENREYVIDWLANVINRNVERKKMQVDRIAVCSDGFMINLTAVLLKLCEPFLNLSSKKIDLIDPEYLITYDRLNHKGETRLISSEEEVNQWIKERRSELENSMDIDGDKKSANFITECFYFTARSIDLGLRKIFARFTRHMRNFNEHVLRRKVLSESTEFMSNPRRADILAEADRKIKKLHSITLCFSAHLNDPELLRGVSRFFTLLAYWLVKIAVNRDSKTKKTLELPLKDPPKYMATLPQYFVGSIVDWVLYLATQCRDAIATTPMDELMTFLVTYLSSSEYVKNPYLRGRIVEALSTLRPKVVGEQFMKINVWLSNAYASVYLPEALIRFYIDIEHTGSSNQFYDKFNSRYYTALVIKYVWKLDKYNASFRKQANNSELFVRFVNMVLNDSIFLLDESLAKLSSIKSLQEEMGEENWLSLPAISRQEKEQEMIRLERQVRTYLLLAKETIKVMFVMSRDVPEPFLRSELIDRVSSMLDYFLVKLAGDKMTTLKVQNPEKYNWNPKWLLTKIVGIYLHFGKSKDFMASVAKDGRSYSNDVFITAHKICAREKLIGGSRLSEFLNFINSVHEEAKKLAVSEKELGVIPDHYLDPILQTLMKDPVILPSSKVTVDRSTITRHLLSDETDPFNRSKLTADMLVPNEDLKKEIENWLKSKAK